MVAIKKMEPERSTVLYAAVLEALPTLGLSQEELGQVIGLDRTTISRRKEQGFDPKSKPGELALYLVRIFRALYALVGGDRDAMLHWMTTNNYHLNGVPKVLVQTGEGLVNVMQYLDAIRGKV